jgi:hypothetical protein
MHQRPTRRKLLLVPPSIQLENDPPASTKSSGENQDFAMVDAPQTGTISAQLIGEPDSKTSILTRLSVPITDRDAAVRFQNEIGE